MAGFNARSIVSEISTHSKCLCEEVDRVYRCISRTDGL